MFSLSGFQLILEEVLRHGYSFGRFDESAKAGKCFYLRHDVDISPRNALRLGGLAREKGCTSNILFQLNAETYNCFSPETLSIITELGRLGHCVGLHIDEPLIGHEGDRIRQTLRWFSECCAPIDMVVSFHRPSPAVLGATFEGFSSGYESRVWGEDRYLSDSRRSWGFRAQLTEWLNEGRTPIQLLLHPEWWYSHTNVEEIWADLSARRLDELSRYMVKNFPKVFSPVISISNARKCEF